MEALYLGHVSNGPAETRVDEQLKGRIPRNWRACLSQRIVVRIFDGQVEGRIPARRFTLAPLAPLLPRLVP